MAAEEIDTNIQIKVIESYSIDKNNEHINLPKNNEVGSNFFVGLGFVVIIFFVFMFSVKIIPDEHKNL
ncbi:hypothetical protein IGL98_003230 [Enterococcus sp. DIV0840]|uniref:hypothetical protein n=1 Tax=Enterococcus TaxID=1350 RepID=UPI001A8FFE1C|nr:MULTISPECIES: hypothetical protein [Enterococcus]MBO0434830.1 hypothetical protein [Enterococcus sp. DIV0849a]MBO0475253.1 hypothetical protein [Enterococcus ureasiticus]